jgi:AAHS family 4-hydroxybenzoate transporter-like MFS transporter
MSFDQQPGVAGAPLGNASESDVDIGHLLDHSPWGGYQKLVLFLTCLALVLDGFDTLALGFAAPAILPEFGVTKAALAPVLAVGLIGMTAGAMIGGFVGDRVGRKAALILSVATFGLMTCLMATANSLFALGVFRLLAGLGLGGALPNAAALVAEFTPLKRRSLAVTLSIVCIPVGGVVGGFAAAAALPEFGWRGLLLIAGAAPVLVALLLLALLPESPRFLVRRLVNPPALRRTFAKMGIEFPAEARLVDRSEPDGSKGRVTALVRQPLLADTIALWVAFFACLLAVYMSYNWLPTMLSDAGFDLRTSSTGLLAFNVGAIIAAIGAAWLTGHFGSRPVMLALAGGGAAAAIGLAFVPMDPDGSRVGLIAALAFEGACIAGVQVILYALAAHVYPTLIRATGVGAAAGIGRIGAVLSTFIGAAGLSAAGADGFYAIVAGAMLTVAIAIGLVSRHVAPKA